MGAPRQTPARDPGAELKAAMLSGGNPEKKFLAWDGLPDTVKAMGDPPPVVPDPEPEPGPAAPAAPEPTPESPANDSPDPKAPPAEEPGSSVVEKILGDYGSNEDLAAAYKRLRKLQQGSPAEQAQAVRLVERLSESSDFGEDGEPVLKLDVAAARLARARNNGEPVVEGVPDEKAVRQQAADEIRAAYKGQIHADDMDDFIKSPATAKIIDQRVAGIMAEAKHRVRAVRIREATAIQENVDRFFEENPSYQPYADHIDEWFGEMPPDLRVQVLAKSPRTLARIARAERISRDFKNRLTEAFEAGRKAGGSTVKPADGSVPRSTGTGTPRGGAGSSQGDVADFKAAVVGAGKLASISSLWGK